MENILERLLQHPFFIGFPPEDVKQIADHARETQFYAGERIFQDGDKADTFYLIENGLVALEVGVANYGAVTVEYIHSDDVLGWSWLYPPFQWHFDARARQATKTIAFPARIMHEILEKDLEFAYRLSKRVGLVVINRLQATRRRLLELTASFPAHNKEKRPNWQVLINEDDED
ncbi:MAG: cyclic nucleotide-binding domain-containing protein [Calditrichia bacterium]